MDIDTHKHPIILFDGVCNYCNWNLNFLIRRDKKDIFRFSAMQSQAGIKLLQDHHLPVDYLATLVLIENERVYLGSTAALRTLRRLSGLWPVFYVLILIPKFLRDAAYRLFAKYRYKLFGRRETCIIPDERIRARFIG